MTTQNGFLLLADITGYTNFLANTPTDVGGRITAGLLDGLVGTVIPPFKVGNIEVGRDIHLCSGRRECQRPNSG